MGQNNLYRFKEDKRKIAAATLVYRRQAIERKVFPEPTIIQGSQYKFGFYGPNYRKDGRD
jgi:hypothetical protein